MAVKIDQDLVNSLDPEVKRRSAESLMFFLKSLKIPSGLGPKRYSEVMESFQEETFESLAKSLEPLRVGDKPPIRRFWIERTKKSGKDSDLAACVLWLMAFPKKPLKVQICAANSKQAGIIKNRALEILYYNPWLNELVEIVEHQIRSKSEHRRVWARIEATDSQGAAHGETPDLLILNELVHVAKWQAMADHMANADGVPRGVVIISTNAGIKGTPAHTWKINALNNTHRWANHVWDKVAPWINKEDVAEAKARDPIGTEYARLWEGKWISGRGGAVSDADIDSCFTLDGPLSRPEKGWSYLAGLDLGVSHDHAAVVVVGVNRKLDRMRIARIRAFVPEVKNDQGQLEVDLIKVEKYCVDVFKKFQIRWLGYDPAAGGSFMAQRLRKQGVIVSKINFSMPSVQTQMATAFVLVMKAKKLECFEDPEGRLRRDFGKFSIETKIPSGYKLVAVSDEFGHADVGVALVITLPRIVDELGGWERFDADDDLTATNEEMTEEEMEDMPDEFKEIISDPFEGWGE